MNAINNSRSVFHYVPLEALPERYTIQLSNADPDKGWITNALKKNNVDFKVIEGTPLTGYITNGSVLDACGRGYYAASQIQTLLRKMHEGVIRNGDIIYFDDFFHPGLEAIQYAEHLLKIKLFKYSLLHAQSVDIHDFTYPMREWMRPIEVAYGNMYDKIFVSCKALKDLVVLAGIGSERKVHISGLPVNVGLLKRQVYKTGYGFGAPSTREPQVVISSRFDKEKNPWFWMNLIKEYKIRMDAGSAMPLKFVACTSAKQLRSNNPAIITAIKELEKTHGDVFRTEVGLSKEAYYKLLGSSRFQFNCARQDFISWTLIEAVAAGCIPIYPHYLSFPEVLPAQYMYRNEDLVSAIDLINNWNSGIDLDDPNSQHSKFCLDFMANQAGNLDYIIYHCFER